MRKSCRRSSEVVAVDDERGKDELLMDRCERRVKGRTSWWILLLLFRQSNLLILHRTQLL